MVSTDFVKRLAGYGLTTAEILYRMPDHPGLVQSFLWQEYDIAPRFPELKRFLDFWMRSLDGPLVSVRIAHAKLLTPAEVRLVGSEYRLH